MISYMIYMILINIEKNIIERRKCINPILTGILAYPYSFFSLYAFLVRYFRISIFYSHLNVNFCVYKD